MNIIVSHTERETERMHQIFCIRNQSVKLFRI